jgi:uncharacterized membrane protein
MSGGLLMVPESTVRTVPEMKVEELLRVYFSVGALAPDCIPGYLKDELQSLPPTMQELVEQASASTAKNDPAE